MPVITGGSFSGDVSSYISADYQCKLDDGMYKVTGKDAISVTKPEGEVSAPEVSTSVGGVSIPENTESEETGVTTENQTISLDATVTESAEGTIKTANVTVGGSALETISNSTAVSDVEIKTNVGTITVTGAALDSIVSAAAEDGQVSDVTLTIKNVSEDDKVMYDLSATANGAPVFNDKAETAEIKVTVPTDKPEGETVYVYYLGEGGTEFEAKATATVVDGETVITWPVTHFSTRLIGGPVAFTDENGAVAFDTFEQALDAANASANGGTLTIGEDIVVTIDDLSELLAVNKDIKLNGEGSLTNTRSRVALKVEAAKEKALLTIDNGGKLTIDGVTVNIYGAVVSADPINYNNIAVCMMDGSALDVTGGGKLYLGISDEASVQGINKGFYIRGTAPVDAAITVEGQGSGIYGYNIDGYFSQGGIWTVKSGAEIAMDNIGTHGLSAYQVTVEDGGTVNISNTELRGISINENGGKLDIQQGATVNVTNCGSETVPAVYMDKDNENTLSVKGELNVTKTDEAKSTVIALSQNSGSAADTTGGQITGDIDVGEKAAQIQGGGLYDTLDDAIKAAASGQTVVMLKSGTIGETIGSGVTVVVPSGMSLLTPSDTDILASTGTLEVQKGGQFGMTIGGTEYKLVGDGDDCIIGLDSGSVSVVFGTGAVTVSDGTKATIKNDLNLTIEGLKLDVTIESGATANVAAKLTVPHGSFRRCCRHSQRYERRHCACGFQGPGNRRRNCHQQRYNHSPL